MNQNILKGLLILWVVVDHNDYSRSIFPGFLLGFSFHVVGFMALPFLREWPKLSSEFVVSNFFRLYYPFFMLTLLLGVTVAASTHGSVPETAGRLLKVWFSGNSEILKQTTRMALLWFVPSMLSVLLILALLGSCQRRVAAGLLVATVACHFFIGTVATKWQYFQPMGLLPALYVVPLAALIALLHNRWLAHLPRLTAVLVCAGAFTAAKYAQMKMGLYQEVGFSTVADHRAPLALLVNDLEAVLGALLMIQLARLPLGRFIEACGKYSMQIYLFHGFIGFGFYWLLTRLNWNVPVAYKFGLSLSLTVLLSAALAAMVMSREPIRRFVFPRGWADLAGRRTPRIGLKRGYGDLNS